MFNWYKAIYTETDNVELNFIRNDNEKTSLEYLGKSAEIEEFFKNVNIRSAEFLESHPGYFEDGHQIIINWRTAGAYPVEITTDEQELRNLEERFEIEFELENVS